MIVTETVQINGSNYLHNYSDEGKMIERNGILYSDAVDVEGSSNIYIESSELAPVTLTPGMMVSPSFAEEDKKVYEIRADYEGNLIANEVL